MSFASHTPQRIPTIVKVWKAQRVLPGRVLAEARVRPQVVPDGGAGAPEKQWPHQVSVSLLPGICALSRDQREAGHGAGVEGGPQDNPHSTCWELAPPEDQSTPLTPHRRVPCSWLGSACIVHRISARHAVCIPELSFPGGRGAKFLCPSGTLEIRGGR